MKRETLDAVKQAKAVAASKVIMAAAEVNTGAAVRDVENYDRFASVWHNALQPLPPPPAQSLQKVQSLPPQPPPQPSPSPLAKQPAVVPKLPEQSVITAQEAPTMSSHMLMTSNYWAPLPPAAPGLLLPELQRSGPAPLRGTLSKQTSLMNASQSSSVTGASGLGAVHRWPDPMSRTSAGPFSHSMFSHSSMSMTAQDRHGDKHSAQHVVLSNASTPRQVLVSGEESSRHYQREQANGAWLHEREAQIVALKQRHALLPRARSPAHPSSMPQSARAVLKEPKVESSPGFAPRPPSAPPTLAVTLSPRRAGPITAPLKHHTPRVSSARRDHSLSTRPPATSR